MFQFIQKENKMLTLDFIPKLINRVTLSVLGGEKVLLAQPRDILVYFIDTNKVVL